MSTTQLAVLVLACTFCNTDTGPSVAVAAIEERAERAFRTIAIFRTSWELRTEAVAPAMACTALGAAIAETVRIRIVFTVHESNTAVSTTTGARLTFLSQGYSRDCRSQGRTCYSASNAAYRGTPSDLFISHRFADVFEPISHHHLLSKRSDALCLIVGFCSLQNLLHSRKRIVWAALRELQDA